MKLKKKTIGPLLVTTIFLFGSCQLQKQNEDSNNSPLLSSYSSLGNNFKVSLTDAPNKELAKVNVNIKEILLKIGGASSKRAEIAIARDIGVVDLLTLQNGKMMDLADFNLPIGSKVNQIRLVLNTFGNNIEYQDGQSCDLQIPSQSKTGLKIINPEFEIGEGKSYSLVVDFDAKKSIVHQGNGGCLLKPVLRWGGISAKNPNHDEDEIIVPGGSEGEGEEQDPNEEQTEDSNQDQETESPDLISCEDIEFDIYDIDTWPIDYNFDDYEHCYDEPL